MTSPDTRDLQATLQAMRTLSHGAWRLHMSALIWTAHVGTGGHIASKDLEQVSDVKQPGRYTHQLIEAGLWHALVAGYEIRDADTAAAALGGVLTSRDSDEEEA